MLRFCVLCGALVSLASLAWGQEAYAVGGASGTSLWVDGKVVPNYDASNIRHLAWSQEAKFLAVLSEDGTLRIFKPGGESTEFAKGVRSFSWSPVSQDLAFEAEDAVWVGKPEALSEKPVKVVEGQAVAWSPDGARIAFSSKGAIWIALANGGSARRVAINRSAIAMDWSADGRKLGFQEKGLSTKPGGIFVVGVNRYGLRKVGEGRAERVAFSPDARRLLLIEKPRSRVLEIENGTASNLAPEGSCWSWCGSKKISGLLGPVPVQAELPDGTMQPLPKAEGLPEGVILKWAEAGNVLISNDLLSKGPFANAAKPIPESIRIQGFVESVDPLNGRFTLSVGTVIDYKGWETNLAQSLSQRLTVPDTAKQNDGTGRLKPLRVMNIRPDLEVSVIVRAPVLDSNAELEVSEVTIATEGPELGFISKEGPRLLGYPLAYDGVSPEKPCPPCVSGCRQSFPSGLVPGE